MPIAALDDLLGPLPEDDEDDDGLDGDTGDDFPVGEDSDEAGDGEPADAAFAESILGVMPELDERQVGALQRAIDERIRIMLSELE